MTSFAELGVRARTLESLTRQGIDAPNEVQREALPHLLAGHDTVIAAPTGSGKTLAFAVPMIERLQGHRAGGPRALVVGPTRELSLQVATVIAGLDRALRVAVLYGGVGYGAQYQALAGGPDIVVGCPGRILDLVGQGRVNFSAVEYLVLDEADEMLDAGFAREVERIMSLCAVGSARQTVLASATMPDWVQRMIDRHLREPRRVQVAADAEPTLEHGVLHVDDERRMDSLVTLLKLQPAGSGTIVFTRTKHGAKKLARKLETLQLRVAELQGNLSQNARERSIGSFRDGRRGRPGGDQRGRPRPRRPPCRPGRQLRAARNRAMADPPDRPHRAQRRRGPGHHPALDRRCRAVAQAPARRRSPPPTSPRRTTPRARRMALPRRK